MVLTEYDEEKVMRGMYEDGLEEGIEKGRAEGIRYAARKMKENGVSIDIIAKCTDLTEDEIKAL